MIDGETSLKSLMFVSESLEQLLGANGAKAVLRTAGQRAAISLIEMLPLSIIEEDAIQRSGAILVELGFIDEMRMPAPDSVQISGNTFLLEMKKMELHGLQSGCYYVIGLFEGFFNQMSGSTRKVIAVSPGESCEYWKLR